MKYTAPPIFYAFLFGCLLLMAACNQPAAQQAAAPAPVVAQTKTVLPQPFRYHKLIESSPGKFFDVLSWGRGVDSSGEYLILHSDSTGKQYSTNYGDLEGAVIDVFNTDMNMDGNPEILIESRAKDTINRINIYAYEFKGGKGQKLDFPKLSDKSKKVYRGGDIFLIKDGFLVREFPVYDGNTKAAKPTGKTRILQYGIRDNTFSVKDISPVDSTAMAKPTAKGTATNAPDKPKVEKKPVVKKHKPEHHAQKTKRHRHRSEG